VKPTEISVTPETSPREKSREYDGRVTDITESAVVVPKASLQAENGFTLTKDHLDRVLLFVKPYYGSA
jgi:hypothetical protein